MSQRKEKRFRQLERRVSAIEVQAEILEHRVPAIEVQDESVVNALYIPETDSSKHRGTFRRIVNFFKRWSKRQIADC